jgi:CheY-like chemotaxis protein
MKVLVVDDDPIARAMVVRLARPVADTVLEAENGLDGLGMLEREDPDILVADLRMPVLDGFELIAAVRQSERHREMPIICLSAVNHGDDIRRLASLGITDYVLKHVRANALA